MAGLPRGVARDKDINHLAARYQGPTGSYALYSNQDGNVSPNDLRLQLAVKTKQGEKAVYDVGNKIYSRNEGKWSFETPLGILVAGRSGATLDMEQLSKTGPDSLHALLPSQSSSVEPPHRPLDPPLPQKRPSGPVPSS